MDDDSNPNVEEEKKNLLLWDTISFIVLYKWMALELNRRIELAKVGRGHLPEQIKQEQ